MYDTAWCLRRNLANLVLAAAKGQPKAQEQPVVQENGGGANAAELDLTGEREFLTRETAQEALAPMLAPGSAITKVTGSACLATSLHVFWKSAALS